MNRVAARPDRFVSLLLAVTLLAGCGPAAQATATPAPAPALAPTPAPSAAAQATVAAAVPTPTALALGSLTVEEYPIVAKDVDTPSHFEFNQRIAPAVLETRAAWRAPLLEGRVAAANDALAQFGYRLVRQGSDVFPCDLYRGEAIVIADVDAIWPVSVAASGSDFTLAVEAPDGVFLAHRNTVEPWDPSPHASLAPVMVGQDLVTVVAAANGTDWEVRRGEQVVHTVRDKPIVVSCPVKGLWSWDGHWALEVDGRVMVDGNDLNADLGYDEVFAWQLLDGQPFYLFRKNGRIGVSYAGQTLAPRYDDVVHYECCEPAAFNVEGNGAMVWGYALRDGMWHYAEMGVYGSIPH